MSVFNAGNTCLSTHWHVSFAPSPCVSLETLDPNTRRPSTLSHEFPKHCSRIAQTDRGQETKLWGKEAELRKALEAAEDDSMKATVEAVHTTEQALDAKGVAAEQALDARADEILGTKEEDESKDRTK